MNAKSKTNNFKDFEHFLTYGLRYWCI